MLNALPLAPALCAPDAPPQLRQACDEYLVGLERTYRLTCYVAILAVIVGTFLPGWPFAWEGRQSQQASQARLIDAVSSVARAPAAPCAGAAALRFVRRQRASLWMD